MSRVATKKQRGFAKDYVETGNATQAVLKNYDTSSVDVAKSLGSENLAKPNVRALIESYAERATKNIQTLAETAENESVRLKANIDQVDRAGYVAITKSVNLTIEADASPEIKELAARLNDLYGK